MHVEKNQKKWDNSRHLEYEYYNDQKYSVAIATENLSRTEASASTLRIKGRSESQV
jgi:hypothetical protein